MTNIALAFKHHPEIIPKIQEIVVMGGGSFLTDSVHPLIGEYTTNPKQWDRIKIRPLMEDVPKNDESTLDFVCKGNKIHLFPNHNFSGDTLAAIYVFSNTNLPIKIICHSITSRFWLKGPAIQFLHDRASEARAKGVLDDEVTEVVGLIMEEWFKRRNGQNGQCPHDPLTVHEAAFGNDKSPIYYVNGVLLVHHWAAFSTFIPNEDGKHMLGIYVHQKGVDKFLDFLGRTITNNYNNKIDTQTSFFPH